MAVCLVGCYIWYSVEGSPPRPLLAIPKETAHPSTASVQITVLLYNGPLLCGFNVPVKQEPEQEQVTATGVDGDKKVLTEKL